MTNINNRYKVDNKSDSLFRRGWADIVRVSCPDESSTKVLKEIVKEVKAPLVADIHFRQKELLRQQKWEPVV